MKFEIKNVSGKSAFWGLLLAVTLCFPSTREAHTLCLRWLLHLNGNTFVRGIPPGSDVGDVWFYGMPNVQFTPKYLTKLRGRAANSLDDFALFSMAADDYYFHVSKPPFPRIESAWKNDPLLPWMTFQMAQRAANPYDTNIFSPAALSSQLQVLHLAQSAWPDDGAFWQAEAGIEFGAHNTNAALQTLWTSVSKPKADAGSGPSFRQLILLEESAGLPKTDVAIQIGYRVFLPMTIMQGENRRSLEGLMTQAVAEDKPQDSLRLLKLLAQILPMQFP